MAPRRPDSSPIDLNLDALDREGGTPAPYAVVLGGKRYVFGDLREMDWQRLLEALRNPYVLFEYVLSADDYAAFLKAELPAWKLNKLLEGYKEHYGLPSLGEAAASPAS